MFSCFSFPAHASYSTRVYCLAGGKGNIRFWDIAGQRDRSFLAQLLRWLLKTKDYQRRYRVFRDRLRQAREEAELTQEQVAKAVGRPQSFISKCESGERRVGAVELTILAALYKEPLSYFLQS